MFDNSIVLNNGVKIPQLGLGTWFIDDDKAADAIRFQKWSLIAVFLHLITVFYPLSDSPNAEYLLWNENRVQIKKDLNDL